MTGLEWLKAAEAKLREAKAECRDYRFHAQQVFGIALHLAVTQVLLKQTEPLSEAEEKALNAVLSRRLSGEPLQYIEGIAGFWKSEFQVGPGVLIPRPETELLVEACLNIPGSPRVAELGPGTGNIGISVLLERDWQWDAFEKNSQSVPYLKKNLALLPQGHRFRLHEGDFFSLAEDRYDLLVSNPPYIASEGIASLSSEVRKEPVLALDGGPDGLKTIRALLDWTEHHLVSKGMILLEIGSDQELAISELSRKKGLPFQILSDLQGKARVFQASKP